VDRRKGKKLRGEHLQNVDDLESFYRKEGRNLNVVVKSRTVKKNQNQNWSL
jgi:hypothetical protein